MKPTTIVRSIAFRAAGSILIMCVCVCTGFALFEDTSVGGRATGLGGVIAALTNDAYAAYQNPAGLALISQTQFAAQYSRLYVGLTDKSNLGYSYLGIARPFRLGAHHIATMGLGWLRFALNDLYQEDTVLLSYATYGLLGRSSLGVSVKLLNLQYGQDEYTRNALDDNGNALFQPDALFALYGNSKSNIDLDIGLQHFIGSNYQVGFVMANLMEPNMALQPGVAAGVPRAFKLGLARLATSYILNLDTVYKLKPGNSDWLVSLGAEKSFLRGIALRAGMTIGSRELSNVTVGIGYRLEGADIDYALVYPFAGVHETMGSHRISILARFGPVFRDRQTMEIEIERFRREGTEQKLREAEARIARLKERLDTLTATPISSPVPATAAASDPQFEREYKEYLKVSARLEKTLRKKKLTELVGKFSGRADLASAEKELASLSAARSVDQAPQQLSRADFLAEFASYQRNAVFLTLANRVNALAALLARYRAADIPEAIEEHNQLTDDLRRITVAYNEAMNTYRAMVAQGLPVAERKTVLNKIIAKFESQGIDVKAAQALLKRLTTGRP